MKEISIEEKAKRYDEAIKVAQRFYNNSVAITKKGLEDIFPELKESEGEKIRKSLIDMLKNDEKHYLKEIAWLERQGEQKTVDEIAKEVCKNKESATAFLKSAGIMNEKGELAEQYRQGEQKSIDDLTQQEAMDIAVAKCFVQGEQKPADKVEPKLKIEEGKWYVCISQFCNCIESRAYKATSDSRIMDDFGTEYDMHDDAYRWFRPWTIQDAKDGDVLIDKSNGRECPFIFKETKPSNIKTDVLNPLSVLGYCGIGGAGFTKGSGWGDTANCIYYPATKEQRDQLEKAITEAGYEWDADKKELKKIEQQDVNIQINPSEYINNMGGNGCYLKNTIQRHAWSEEDEYCRHQLIEFCEHCMVQDSSAIRCADWLKSLKDRVQPQNSIVTNEELDQAKKDAYNDALDKIEYHSDEPTFDDGWSAAIDYIRKKFLKDRVQPQNIVYYNPYKEVVESIAEMCKHYDKASHSGLRDFYDNVKVKCKDAKEYDSLYPQSTWKPSESDIRILEKVIDGTVNPINYHATLYAILEKLKKLREE